MAELVAQPAPGQALARPPVTSPEPKPEPETGLQALHAVQTGTVPEANRAMAMQLRALLHVLAQVRVPLLTVQAESREPALPSGTASRDRRNRLRNLRRSWLRAGVRKP